MYSKKVCRLCLVQTPSYSSLLEDKTAKMLEALTSIKVNRKIRQTKFVIHDFRPAPVMECPL
jgi:hypothetical protein